MDIFSDWLLKLNSNLKILNRHILLLIDNAGGHNITEDTKKKLTHVDLEYFDPNVTSHIQPLDMGIIRSFKAHYRKALVRHCLKTIEEKESIIMPTVKEALILIKNSWKKVKNHFCFIFYLFLYIYACIIYKVTKETIVNC